MTILFPKATLIHFELWQRKFEFQNKINRTSIHQYGVFRGNIKRSIRELNPPPVNNVFLQRNIIRPLIKSGGRSSLGSDRMVTKTPQ